VNNLFTTTTTTVFNGPLSITTRKITHSLPVKKVWLLYIIFN